MVDGLLVDEVVEALFDPEEQEAATRAKVPRRMAADQGWTGGAGTDASGDS